MGSSSATSGQSDEARALEETSLEFQTLPVLALRQIFRHLSVEDLKSCRLVCRRWAEEALAGMRRIGIFHLPSAPRLALNWEKIEETPWPRIALSPAHSVGSMEPVLRYLINKGETLKMLRFHCRNTEEAKQSSFLHTILNQLARNIEELELRLDVMGLERNEVPFHVATFGNMNTPALKRISIYATGSQAPFGLQEFVNTLLSGTKNLEGFKVWANCEPALQLALQGLKNSPLGSGMKELTLGGSTILTLDGLRTLVSLPKEVKLERVSLGAKFVPRAGVDYALNDFLRKHSGSLKVLKLKGELEEKWREARRPDRHPYRGVALEEEEEEEADAVPFHSLLMPFMNKLKVLEISDIFHLRPAGYLFDFLSQLPSLVVLRMRNVTYASNVSPLTPDGVLEELFNPERGSVLKHEKLEEVDLDGEIRLEDIMERLVRGLPALKRLKIKICTGAVFATMMLCLSKTNVEELDVRIRQICEFGWCNYMMETNLPKMKCLQYLRLMNASGHCPFYMPSETVLNGICEAPSLKALELSNFSLPASKKEMIWSALVQKCFKLQLSNCVLHSDPFNADFEWWAKSEPIP